MYKNDGTIVSGPDGVIMKMPSIKKAELLVKALTNAYNNGKIEGKVDAENYGAAYLDVIASSCNINQEILADRMADYGVKLSK